MRPSAKILQFCGLVLTAGIVILIVSFTNSSNAFVTKWQTTTPNESITIPTNGINYSYTVDWGDGTISSGHTADATHMYSTPGIHTIKITGLFPHFYLNDNGDKNKILSIEQWGNIQWTSMHKAFAGAENLVYNASDSPDLSAVTDLSLMFLNAKSFNGDLSNWNVSNITNMHGTFFGATSFNGNITTWDVGNVQNMFLMFTFANAFNQDISGWNVINATNLSHTFNAAPHLIKI